MNKHIDRDMPKQKLNFKASFGKLIKYCKPQLLPIILGGILAIAGTIFTILSPDKFSEMTTAIQNGITSSIDIEQVTKIAITLIVFYCISVTTSYFQGFIFAGVSLQITRRLRQDVIHKINKLPLKYFDTTSHGDVLSKVVNDSDTIGFTISQVIGSCASSIVMFVGSIIMMFVTNWLMAISAIISSVLGFAFMALVTKNSSKYFLEQRTVLGEMNGHVEEVYSGHNVVKAYNAEQPLSDKFEDINSRLAKSSFKGQALGGLMMPFMNFVGNLGYVAVCIVGALLVINGEISFGVIVAFMVYVNLFTRPLSDFADYASTLQQTGAASVRVFDLLHQQELQNEDEKTKQLTNVNGDVVFKNVSFGYNKDKVIIHNFSANIKSGQKVAIVGPTGAGKTTLVNLLMRFYETDSGDITIDGTSIKDITRQNLHDQFCMVLQDSWLFNASIKENIVYNNTSITDRQVEEVCKMVGLHQFIKTLPNGYDTILNEENSLSAGQKQLVTIARAMLSNAPMLILDEATSNVDTRTEILIQQAMDKLAVGRTSFVIAHRLSTIKNADLILVLKDGDIIECGNHTELLAKNGFYAELYNSQFNN